MATRARPAASTEAGAQQSAPGQPTPLIGRDEALAAARALVLDPDVRLVTLTGPPGVGKTRLALALTESVAGDWPDAVHFVDLAPLGAARLVLPAVAQALGVWEASQAALLPRLRHVLGPRRALLLLDNFEQVHAAAPALAELLAGCPGLKLLVTSRSPLRLRWEHALPVAPLEPPPPGMPRTPAALAGSPAVALFVARARAVAPGFALNAHNAGAVAELCTRLDGLPLALELAATQSDVLSPAEILEGQRRSGLDLLDRGLADLPARQRTLRGTIRWSWRLLRPTEKAVLRRLSVFRDGCTLQGALAVAGAGRVSAGAVRRALAALLRANLVRQMAPPDAPPRFLVLETVRAYALERLAASGEGAPTERRHAAHCLALAEEGGAALIGPDQVAWLDRLELEHANLLEALRWHLEEGEAEAGLRLGAALWRFWWARGYLSDGRQWLRRLLDLPGALPGAPQRTPQLAARATALAGAGKLAYYQGDHGAAFRLHAESLELRRRLSDRQGIAASLNDLGFVSYQEGDGATAGAHYAESLALSREAENPYGVAETLSLLGLLESNAGNATTAGTLWEESLALSRRLGDRWGVANVLHHLAQGATDRRDHATARAHLTEGLELGRELGDRWTVAAVLEALGRSATSAGDPAEGVRLAGAAAALREAMGAPPMPVERATLDAWLSAARRTLGAGAYAAAWEEGRRAGSPPATEGAPPLGTDPLRDTLPPQDAVPARDTALLSGTAPPFRITLPPGADAAAPPGAAGRSPGATAPAGGDARPVALGAAPANGYGPGLTPREREVAALVARGLTNRQIAGRLLVAERTAEKHVCNILAKLSFVSRAQVAAWTVEQGLRTADA